MTSRTLTFVVWALLGAATVAMVLLAAIGREGLLRRPNLAVPAYLGGHRTVRVVALIAWAWAGWHFFAR